MIKSISNARDTLVTIDRKRLRFKLITVLHNTVISQGESVAKQVEGISEKVELCAKLEKYHSAGWNIIYGECCSIND